MIGGEVKQFGGGWWLGLVLLGCEPRPDATSSTTAMAPTTGTECRVIARPRQTELVRVGPTGAITRWPIVRPSCARVGHRAAARVDGDGLVLMLDDRDVHVGAFGTPDDQCLARVHLQHAAAVIVDDEASWRITADGRRSREPLPPGVLAAAVRGMRAGTIAVALDGSSNDDAIVFVSPEGRRLRPLFLRPADPDTEVVVAALDSEHGRDVPDDVVASERDGRAALWTLRRSGDGGRVRRVARVGDRSIAVSGPVALARDRVLHLRGPRLEELRADGDDRVRLTLAPDVDVAGTPLGPRVRERVAFVHDRASDQIVVTERLRSPDCSLEDRITVIGADDQPRALGLLPAMRTNVTVSRGNVWFAESTVDYEAFSDDSGTSRP